MNKLQEVVLIPSLDPDDKLVQVVRGCREQGFAHIVLVDDGSREACREPFRQAEGLGAVVLRHDKNRGKGAALKTGIRDIAARFPDAPCIVTADGDGQHRPEDIRAVANAATERNALVLGTRDLDDPATPRRSRFGNRFSALFFRLATGVKCPDTQTGLRGLPRFLWDFALSVEGNRYEYEMNLLMAAAERKYPLEMVPIHTIYFDNNRKSHFRTFRDAFLVYRRPIRFAAASLSSSVVDLVVFTLLMALFFDRENAGQVMLATVIARCLSGIYNFAVNKKWSFSAKGSALGQAVRYLILFLCLMLASGGIVSLLRLLPMNITVLKLIVDLLLFAVSYFVQRRWVFRT